MSGLAQGVDRTAEQAAHEHSLLTVAWVPSLLPVVPRASRDGLLGRNTLIAIDCTRMVVFPDGSKGGCWDAARQAKRFRRPCEIRWADGRVEVFR